MPITTTELTKIMKLLANSQEENDDLVEQVHRQEGELHEATRELER